MHLFFQNGGEAATVAPQFSFVPLLGNEGNNWPWRGAKGSAFEGGSRVPAIFVSPFLLPNTRGTQRDFLMHITDWLPTLHSIITGAPYPTGKSIACFNTYMIGRHHPIKASILLPPSPAFHVTLQSLYFYM